MCNDAPDAALAVHGVDHHIVLGVVPLQPEGDYQVAVLHGGEHAVALRLGQQEHLGKHQPTHSSDDDDPPQQAPIPSPQGDGIPAPCDYLRRGRQALSFLLPTHRLSILRRGLFAAAARQAVRRTGSARPGAPPHTAR